MIFFNLKAFEKKLIEGNVSGENAFNYFLILSLLSSLSLYLLNDDAVNSQILLFEILLTVTLNYFGLKQCFNLNSTGDNKDFCKRMFSLSFVVFVRVFCVCILLLIPYILIPVGLGLKMSFKVNSFIEIFDFLSGKILQIIFYIIMYKSLYRISRHNIVNG